LAFGKACLVHRIIHLMKEQFVELINFPAQILRKKGGKGTVVSAPVILKWPQEQFPFRGIRQGLKSGTRI
jgi:hypothetical protein